jgi:hypothetical protein
MTTRGFYWFKCADFPEPYGLVPQLAPNTSIKQFGEDELNALANVNDLARRLVRETLGDVLATPPIRAKAYRFVELQERRKGRTQ